jgi:DNA primase
MLIRNTIYYCTYKNNFPIISVCRLIYVLQVNFQTNYIFLTSAKTTKKITVSMPVCWFEILSIILLTKNNFPIISVCRLIYVLQDHIWLSFESTCL